MTNALASTTSSSSSSSTSSSGVLRITGMASGIDTDAVVKSMVSSYQTKIDKANQAQQTLQWKQDEYRTIITGIKGLQEYFDPLSSKYILSGNTMNINSTTNSNSSIASATASSSAKTGTYSVTTTQLATQSKIEGIPKDSMLQVTDPTKWAGQSLSFDVNGTKVSLTNTLAGSTAKDLVNNINNQITSSSLNGKITASYVKEGTGTDAKEYIKFTKASSNTDTIKLTNAENTISEMPTTTTINSGVSSSSLLNTIGFTGDDTTPGTINFTLANGTSLSSVKLTVNSSTTVQNLMDAVNSATSGAVTMGMDDTTGEISFQSKSYGSTSNISIIDASTGSNSISNLGISSSTTATYTGTMKSTTSSNITSKSLLNTLGFTSGDSSFTLKNGTTPYTVQLTVDSSTTVQDLMDAVNSKTNGAVRISADYTNGKILFNSNTNSDITNITNDIANTTNNINAILNLSSGKTTGTYAGTDAMVSITAPGQAAVTTTQSSNRFTSNGVTYNLVNTGTASTTVTADADAVVSNIKSFITDYNTIISTINTQLTDKKDSAYPPLTDAQKASMSTAQISAWEAKAKVGILRNDDNLSSMMTQLRGIFSSSVYSNYDSSTSSSNAKIPLSFGQYGTNAIGIDTSSDYTDGGKLVLQDESKLTDAIENNFDDFKKMFIGTTNNTALSTNQSYIGSSNYMEDGLFTRMSNILKDYVATPGLGTDGTYTLAGSMNIFVNKQYDYSSTGYSGKNTIPDQIYKQTVSIANLKTQMSDAETRYYNKFSALESLMSTLSSQQSTLTSMLG
jgi:flagellar hook-associated protein 2